MKLRARLRKLILWSTASFSVLLAVAWIGSVWWYLKLEMSGCGEVIVSAGRFIHILPDNLSDLMHVEHYSFLRVSRKLYWSFAWNHLAEGDGYIVPLWAPLIFTSAITAFTWRKDVIARRRANQHKCPACGYDMAGLAAAASCPECGKTDINA